MQAYYEARAREYEAVYAKPERQSDLTQLKEWLVLQARGRVVLEVACGTGYWTAIAAVATRFIVATDVAAEPLKIARAKGLGSCVTFCQADAYELPRFDREFDCGMAHFWWSHVPNGLMHQFLAHFSSRLSPGANLLLIDNTYVAGSSTPISRRDTDGNTYQIRTLSTGEQHEVLKNFHSAREIEVALGTICSQIEVLQLKYYWAARAVLA
jgi:SAM-dependent methyltransferase